MALQYQTNEYSLVLLQASNGRQYAETRCSMRICETSKNWSIHFRMSFQLKQWLWSSWQIMHTWRSRFCCTKWKRAQCLICNFSCLGTLRVPGTCIKWVNSISMKSTQSIPISTSMAKCYISIPTNCLWSSHAKYQLWFILFLDYIRIPLLSQKPSDRLHVIFDLPILQCRIRIRPERKIQRINRFNSHFGDHVYAYVWIEVPSYLLTSKFLEVLPGWVQKSKQPSTS